MAREHSGGCVVRSVSHDRIKFVMSDAQNTVIAAA